MRRVLIAAAVVCGTAFVLSIVAYGRSHTDAIPEPPASDTSVQPTPAPAFAATTVDGRRVTLQTFAGRPLVINIFAAWCSPCQREAPTFARLHHAYGRRVQLLGLALESTRSGVLRFLRDYGWTWPIVQSTNYVLAHRFSAPGYPTTVVIDQRGRIVFRQIGPVDPRRLRATLDRLLEA
jgi:cytochrome c biogenesis protein CcmG, thiol:disulfide interchange protein DsbE